jgi:hypothetical protein
MVQFFDMGIPAVRASLGTSALQARKAAQAVATRFERQGWAWREKDAINSGGARLHWQRHALRDSSEAAPKRRRYINVCSPHYTVEEHLLLVLSLGSLEELAALFTGGGTCDETLRSAAVADQRGSGQNPHSDSWHICIFYESFMKLAGNKYEGKTSRHYREVFSALLAHAGFGARRIRQLFHEYIGRNGALATRPDPADRSA